MKKWKKRLVTFCLFALLAAPVISGVLPDNFDYAGQDEGISTRTVEPPSEDGTIFEDDDKDIHC